MIRFIAAIDPLRGLATHRGLPFYKQYCQKQIGSGIVLMDNKSYGSPHVPTSSRVNYVLTSHVEPLVAGFHAIDDLDSFLSQKLDIWVVGGSQLFERLIDDADELWITQVSGDFGCIEFFPPFERKFFLHKRRKIAHENDIDFQYQIWKSNRLLTSSDSAENV